jgi:hypothetical protein
LGRGRNAEGGGAVGELGKNLTPSKRRICRIHEKIRE